MSKDNSREARLRRHFAKASALAQFMQERFDVDLSAELQAVHDAFEDGRMNDVDFQMTMLETKCKSILDGAENSADD